MFHTQSNVAILFREFSTSFTESLAELSKNIQTQLDNVQKELNVTKTEHSALKSEFQVIEHSLDYTQTEVDEIKKELALVKQENAQMKETIAEFKSGSTNKDLVIKKLEEALTNKILNIERYTREFNIRLVAIGEKSGENSKKIVAQKICELNLLGEDLNELLQKFKEVNLSKELDTPLGYYQMKQKRAEGEILEIAVDYKCKDCPDRSLIIHQQSPYRSCGKKMSF